MSTPFHTDIYTRLWRRHVAPHINIMAQNDDFAICRLDRLKGLLPTRQILFIGEKNDWAQEVSPAFLEGLSDIMSIGSWDYVKLISRDKPSQPLLDFAESHQLLQYSWHSNDEYRVIFDDKGWEGYLRSLKSRVRCEFRRKIKNASPLNPELRLLNMDPGLDRYISLFMEKHIRYWAERNIRSLYAEPYQQDMFRAWVHELIQTGELRFYGMFMNDTLCCIRIGLKQGEEYLSLLTINTNDEYAAYSPGILAAYTELETTCNEGFRIFNMGPGKSRAKGHFANSIIPYYTTALASPASLTGRLFILKKQYDNRQVQTASGFISSVLKWLPQQIRFSQRASVS